MQAPYKKDGAGRWQRTGLYQAMVMGIINATPDSFYPASRTQAQNALTVAEKMLQDGADILDIGGASTRPGTELVTKEEEQQRVLPVIKSIKEHFPEMHYFCRYILGRNG
jgi:dihydropteroate synthase